MIQNEHSIAACKGVINIIPIAYDSAFIPDFQGKASELNGIQGWNEYSLFFNASEAANIPEVKLLQTWFAKTNPGQPLNLYAMFAWADGRLFQQAFEHAGPTASRATVLAALKKIKNFSDDGLIAPTDPGSKTTGNHCYVLWQLQNGQFSRMSDPKTGYRCDGTFLPYKNRARRAVTLFASYVILGLVTGCVYALISIGLVVTYTTTGIFNFAHGAVAMMAAFTFWQLWQGWHLNVVLSVFLVLVVIAPLFGLIVERVLMRPLEGASVDLTLVVTLGLLLFLVGLANLIWSPLVARTLPEFFHGNGFQVAGLLISYEQVLAAVSLVVAAIGLRLLLTRVRAGIAMRAVVDNSDLLAMAGGRPVRVKQMSWAISCSLAALAGILLAAINQLNILDLTLLVVDGYAAAIIGRLRSLPMAIVGAIGIAVGQSVLFGYLPSSGFTSRIQDIIPIIVLFVILIVLPQDRLRSASFTGVIPPRVASLKSSLGGRRGVIAIAAVASTMLSGNNLRIGAQGFALAVVLLSIVLLTGYGGMASLCQMTFVGLGAYAMGHVANGALLARRARRDRAVRGGRRAGGAADTAPARSVSRARHLRVRCDHGLRVLQRVARQRREPADRTRADPGHPDPVRPGLLHGVLRGLRAVRHRRTRPAARAVRSQAGRGQRLPGGLRDARREHQQHQADCLHCLRRDGRARGRPVRRKPGRGQRCRLRLAGQPHGAAARPGRRHQHRDRGAARCRHADRVPGRPAARPAAGRAAIPADRTRRDQHRPPAERDQRPHRQRHRAVPNARPRSGPTATIAGTPAAAFIAEEGDSLVGAGH